MIAYPFVEVRCAWCHCHPCRCPRVMPCACGGTIAAAEGEEPVAVRTHNETAQHRAWRERLP